MARAGPAGVRVGAPAAGPDRGPEGACASGPVIGETPVRDGERRPQAGAGPEPRCLQCSAGSSTGVRVSVRVSVRVLVEAWPEEPPGDMDGERFSKGEAMGGLRWGPRELWSALCMGGWTSNLLGQRRETG